MSQPEIRVVMLCCDDTPSRAVANLLDESFRLQAVIVEEKVSGWKLLKGRARRIGWPKVLGQLAFIVWSKLSARTARSRLEEIYAQARLKTENFPEQTRRVSSVNSEQTRELIQEHAPDVVVVNGTRIIGSATLNCVPAPFVNTHAGITPRYRGVHGGYWALARQDKDHCGVTVHLVDEGIDTGTVLAQALIAPSPQDNFHTYPALQLAAAQPLLLSSITALARGEATPGSGVGPSELFYHPTLWEYLWHRWRHGVQ